MMNSLMNRFHSIHDVISNATAFNWWVILALGEWSRKDWKSIRSHRFLLIYSTRGIVYKGHRWPDATQSVEKVPTHPILQVKHNFTSSRVNFQWWHHALHLFKRSQHKWLIICDALHFIWWKGWVVSLLYTWKTHLLTWNDRWVVYRTSHTRKSCFYESSGSHWLSVVSLMRQLTTAHKRCC